MWKVNDFYERFELDKTKNVIYHIEDYFEISCKTQEKLEIKETDGIPRYVFIYNGNFYTNDDLYLPKFEEFIKSKSIRITLESTAFYVYPGVPVPFTQEFNLTIIDNKLNIDYLIPFDDKGCLRDEWITESIELEKIEKMCYKLDFDYPFFETLEDFEYVIIRDIIESRRKI